MSVLTYNIEVIHNISSKEIKSLDKIDLQLLRQSLMLSSKSARSLILLELQLVSVEYIIKQKRINFLHHLLTEEEDSLSKKIFLKQVEKPVRGDFVKLVNKDLLDCNINLTYDEIKSTPKKKFKEMIKHSIEKASFENLLKEKSKLRKGKEILYEHQKHQGYLKPGNNINIHDMRRIFQLRIRDVTVRGNFPKAYQSTVCLFPGCSSEETQFHLFYSNCWVETNDLANLQESSACYEDIFNNNVVKQLQVMSVIYRKPESRNLAICNDRPLDPRRNLSSPTLVIRKRKKAKQQQTKHRTYINNNT